MVRSHYSEDEDDRRLLFEDENGFGIGFFLHKSITSADQQKKLIQDIEENGGAILDNVRDANTVLVDPMFDLRDALQTSYHIDDDEHIRNTTVEPASFIQRCIRENLFCHRLKAKEGMGGVVPGRTRTPFTNDDIARLCSFIARKMPDKTAGGRFGIAMYREFANTGSLGDETSYARRHTAQSWREHYKKNQDLLDPIIDEIVARENPPATQVYFRDRNAKKGWRSHNRAVEEDYEEREPPRQEEEEEEEEEEDPGYGDENTFVNSRRQSSGSGRKRHHDASIEPPSPKRRRTYAQSFTSQPGNRYRHGPEAVSNQSSDDQDGPENDDSYEGPHFATSRPPSPTLVNQEEQRQKSHSTPRQAAPSQRTSPGVSSLKPRSARRPRNSINSPNPPPRQSKVIGNSGGERNDGQVRPSIHSNPPGIQRSKKVTQAEAPGVPVVEPSPPRNAGPSWQVLNNNAQAVLSSASPAQPTQPKKGKKAANKKASAAPRPVEVPYHNTRSRSRSVEPSTLPPIKPRGKNKSKKPVQEQERNEQGSGPAFEPQLEGIREDVDIGDPPAAAEIASVPIAQTLEEEMDVADLLIDDQSLSVGSISVQQGSLDSDDAQTDHILRASQVQQRRNVPIVQSFLFQDVNPEDILARFQSENPQRYSLPPAPPTADPPSNRTAELRKEGGKPRHSEPSALPPTRNRDSSVLSQNAFFTPQRRSPMRAKIASNSSEESFPLSGTRASAVKKQLRQEEKQTPYTPPAGTKAALYASSTTKRRLRSRNPY